MVVGGLGDNLGKQTTVEFHRRKKYKTWKPIGPDETDDQSKGVIAIRASVIKLHLLVVFIPGLFTHSLSVVKFERFE